jgi:hypothetical protein
MINSRTFDFCETCAGEEYISIYLDVGSRGKRYERDKPCEAINRSGKIYR